MPPCPSISLCQFLKERLSKVPAAVEMIRTRYCATGSPCARHLVASTLGRERVPPDLFPRELDRARQLLDKASCS